MSGIKVSRETIRGELKVARYEWKRAKLKARDDDPERLRRLARIRQMAQNGPWQYRLSEIYYPSEVDVALNQLDLEGMLRQAA